MGRHGQGMTTGKFMTCMIISVISSLVNDDTVPNKAVTEVRTFEVRMLSSQSSSSIDFTRKNGFLFKYAKK